MALNTAGTPTSVRGRKQCKMIIKIFSVINCIEMIYDVTLWTVFFVAFYSFRWRDGCSSVIFFPEVLLEYFLPNSSFFPRDISSNSLEVLCGKSLVLSFTRIYNCYEKARGKRSETSKRLYIKRSNNYNYHVAYIHVVVCTTDYRRFCG